MTKFSSNHSYTHTHTGRSPWALLTRLHFHLMWVKSLVYSSALPHYSVSNSFLTDNYLGFHSNGPVNYFRCLVSVCDYGAAQGPAVWFSTQPPTLWWTQFCQSSNTTMGWANHLYSSYKWIIF